MMSDEARIREEICEIGRRIYERNMVAANDGNISVRLDEHTFLCTPTGVSKGYMTPDSICKIDGEGKALETHDGFKPSSEIRMHMRVYQKRPDVGAVVHAHPIYATTFAVMGMALDKPIMTEAVVSLGCVPITEYATPSTGEVPDSIEKYLPDYTAVLLKNHGALTWAADLGEAWMKMESVEFYARLLYQTELLGGAQELEPEKVKKLYEIRSKMERYKKD